MDFIGINFYPFYTPGGISYDVVKNAISNEWGELKTLQDAIAQKEIIFTEEGWPSAGPHLGQSIPSAGYERDYFYSWYYRDPSLGSYPAASYYFSLFDRFIGEGIESHWGIFSSDGETNIFNDGYINKPLMYGHIIVKFDNEVDKNVSLSVCTEKWDPQLKTQGECYPIYGDVGHSIIPLKTDASPKADLDSTDSTLSSNVKEYMVDVSREYYKSLVVSYEGVDHIYRRLCYLNLNSEIFSSGKTVVLQWKKDDGEVPCEVS